MFDKNAFSIYTSAAEFFFKMFTTYFSPKSLENKTCISFSDDEFMEIQTLIVFSYLPQQLKKKCSPRIVCQQISLAWRTKTLQICKWWFYVYWRTFLKIMFSTNCSPTEVYSLENKTWKKHVWRFHLCWRTFF